MGPLKLKGNKFEQDKFVSVISHGFDAILNVIRFQTYYSKNETKI